MGPHDLVAEQFFDGDATAEFIWVIMYTLRSCGNGKFFIGNFYD